MFKNAFFMLDKFRRLAFSLDSVDSVNTISDKRTPFVLFGSTIIFYVLYLLVMQPNWITGGEMWAEMATNYFQNANSPSYFVKLFSTDVGYIPLVPRLIAFIGNFLSLPAASIPYFYTWTAVLLTSLLVGVFCLPIFRKVINNDFFRFYIVIGILIVADFDTRTFINFTYFASFFASIITALVLVQDKSDNIPAWTWFLPLLIVSKPALLGVIPMMVFASFFSNIRFRRIVFFSVILSILQLFQLLVSNQNQVFPHAESNNLTFVGKIFLTMKYFFELLGKYVTGPLVSDFFYNKLRISLYFQIAFGVIVFFLIFLFLKTIRKRSNSLIIVGMCLLYFNILLNCFSLVWGEKMEVLNGVPIYRQIMPGFIGSILIVAGVTENLKYIHFISKINVFSKIFSPHYLFVGWFVLAGWLTLGVHLSREPKFPVLGLSQWQKFSPAIDDLPDLSLCFPINPYGWLYTRGKGAAVLPDGYVCGAEFKYNDINDEKGKFILKVKPPTTVKKLKITSLGIAIRALNSDVNVLKVKAIVKSLNGTTKLLFGEINMDNSENLIHLTTNSTIGIENVNSVEFIFNTSTKFAYINNQPAIMWMGYE